VRLDVPYDLTDGVRDGNNDTAILISG